MDLDFDRSLSIARKKHDIIAVRIYDERERKIPNIGQIELTDSENGKNILLDTSNKQKRLQFQKNYEEFEKNIKYTLQNSGIDHLDIQTGKDYIIPLINFFKNRGNR